MRRWLLTISMLLLGFFVLCWWWLQPTMPQVTAILTLGASSDSSYSVVGPPSISADFINQVLSAYHSPAAGKGQALYDLGVKYDIDPVYALAFFWHESDFGTTGEARITRSLGNERCITDRPCIDRDRGGYALMNSWEDGFAHWYALIRYGYVEGQVTIPIVGHACTTVDQIVPVYAPSQDGNDVAAYIQAVKQAVDTWRQGQVEV